MVRFPGYDQYLVRHESDPDKRDKQYYQDNVYSFYSEYLKGQSTVGYDGITRIEYLRSFAEGRQVISRTPVTSSRQSALLDTNGNPIKYETDVYPTMDWTSDVWKVLSPANKIMDALSGTLTKIDFEISCDPIDYGTIHEIEDAKLDRWAYMKNRKKIQFAAQVAGVELPEPDYLPESPEDLDQNTDKFLPDHARYVEQVVKHSFDISHWSPDTVTLFYRDLFALNMACVKNEYDPEDGKVKPVYINPATADVQASQWTDCRDSERGWHFYTMSISTLRQYFPDKKEDFFASAAQSYAGAFDNPGTGLMAKYTVQDPYGNWGYDSFKVCVGNFEWIDINTTKEVVSEKRGRKNVKDVPLNKSVAQDKTIRFRDERMRFQAKWVVGVEDGLFEYGPAYDVTYPTKNDTELTYKWIVLPGKSKIEQLVPIFENFYDLWEKYRELLRNSQGKIQFIDIDMLASVQGEGDSVQEASKKAFRRFLSTNKLLFRRVNAAGMPNQNQPIEETDGGMGTLFGEIQQAFKMNIDLVEYITGLNPLSLGQAADPNAPVTTSQMAMNATSNVLRPLVDGYQRMKQMIAENLARWIVVIVRGNEYSRAAYKELIGDYGVQALTVASKGEAAYGFKLVPRPTDLEKQYILQNIEQATNPPAGGEREISTSDANLLINMVMSDTPVKTVNYFFEQARQKQEKALEAKKTALMQKQSELNQNDAKTSATAKMEADKQAHDNKMQQIAETNKGLIANSATQEALRTNKEKEVQQLKNQGILEKQPAA